MAAALELARSHGEAYVFLEGSPAYYGPRGFERADARGFVRPTERVPGPAFQVAVLDDLGARGRLVYADAFWVHDGGRAARRDAWPGSGRRWGSDEPNTCSIAWRDAHPRRPARLAARGAAAGRPRLGGAPRPSWLLDLCPPDYRRYAGLRRHVVVLARFAVLHVEANQAACRRGLSEARADLAQVAGPGGRRRRRSRPSSSRRPG